MLPLRSPNHTGQVLQMQTEAEQGWQNGAVTFGYRGNQQNIVAMLNAALAAELVCVLRYHRHHFMTRGAANLAVKAEFLRHAKEEQAHAELIATRIVQLNGQPDFNPATLCHRSHVSYDESESVTDMIKADLIAERIAIETYRQMLVSIADLDPGTTHMLMKILATEEEHADELRDYLVE